MLANYGLKVVEYGFYTLAVFTAMVLSKTESTQGYTATNAVGVVFVLVGIGVLLPRAIAYRRWRRVVAKVGPDRPTWDGERKAEYAYEIDGQRYTGSYGSMPGSPKLTRLELAVNPQAPWVRYPVVLYQWSFGTIMLAGGLFLLVSGIEVFG